jgi:hypothetical protein
MRIFTLLLLGFALAVSALAATKKVIQPRDFPTGRPFGPGILIDDTLYFSGQTGCRFDRHHSGR